MTPFTSNTVLNAEIIAVDQDALGKQAVRVSHTDDNLDTWVKSLQNNAWAVGLHNFSGASTNMTVQWNDLGLASNAVVQVRDLWAKTDLGAFTNQYTASVASHECVVLKISSRSN